MTLHILDWQESTKWLFNSFLINWTENNYFFQMTLHRDTRHSLKRRCEKKCSYRNILLPIKLFSTMCLILLVSCVGHQLELSGWSTGLQILRSWVQITLSEGLLLFFSTSLPLANMDNFLLWKNLGNAGNQIWGSWVRKQCVSHCVILPPIERLIS